MKTTSGSLPGLVTSLLFNTGFTRIAEKLDPLSAATVSKDNLAPAEPCIMICNWRPQPRAS